MAGCEEGGVASAAPSFQTCAERDCWRAVWTIKSHRKLVVVSDFCKWHSNVPLIDVTTVPAVRPPGRANPAAVFRQEVQRQQQQRDKENR